MADREIAARIDNAMTERGISNTGLAKRANALRSKPGALCYAWSTTRVADYRRGEKSPGADHLKVLAEVLDVSADWLLFGSGPMSRTQDRPTKALADDIAAEVRRRLHARLRWPDDEQDARFEALQPEHLDIDASALLERITGDLEREFRAEADQMLYTANVERMTVEQAETLEALARALTSGGAAHHPALRDANELHMGALAAIGLPRMNGAVRLTDAGITALAGWWIDPEAAAAAARLRRFADRITRKVAAGPPVERR
jgi:transcriptional regulator with XRE-family HTH domain